MDKWLDFISRSLAGCSLLLIATFPSWENGAKLFFKKIIKKLIGKNKMIIPP